MTDKLRDAAQQDIRCECCGYMTHHREHLGCIRAALAQQDAQAVPPGYKLVPVEPTPEMLQAAHDEICDGGLSTTIWLRATCYRAMLNAAPTPPAQEKQS